MRQASRAGTSKADAPAREAADTAGARGVPPGRAAAVAAGRPTGADQIDRLAGDGQVYGRPNRGTQPARRLSHGSQPSRNPVRRSQAGRGPACRLRHDRKRTRRRQQALSWSSGTHRLSRRSNLFYIPFAALQVDNRHTICHFEFRCHPLISRSRSGLFRELPYYGHRYLPGRAARRDVQRADRVKGHRPA